MMVSNKKMRSRPYRAKAREMEELRQRFCPHVDFAKVEAIVPVLVRLLSIEDGDVRADACWAFSYLADCGNQVIDALARAGAAAGLVQLLSCGEPRVVTPAMRAAANILTGTDTVTQAVLDAGFLRALPTRKSHGRWRSRRPTPSPHLDAPPRCRLQRSLVGNLRRGCIFQ